MKRISKAAVGIFCVLLAPIFIYLAVFSLRYTSIIDPAHYWPEHILRVTDAFLLNFLILLVLAAGLFLFTRLERLLSLPLVTALTILIPFAAGLLWVYSAKTLPRADSAQLFNTAADFINGKLDTSIGSYLQRLPYQIGQFYAFVGIQQLFGVENIRAFQVLNVLALTAVYSAILVILWQTLHNKRVQLCACALLILFVPGVLYTTFIYMILPGLALALWGAYFLMRWVHKHGFLRLIAALAFFSLACIVKANYLILALAAMISLLLLALHDRKWKLIPIALCLFVLPFGFSKLPSFVLEAQTGTAFRSGSPQSAWLAMGLQEGSRAAGWYNQYAWDVIDAAEFDTQTARHLVQQSIAERVAVFQADPAYAISFFHSKLTTQWGEPTYESIWVNRVSKHESPRPAFVDAVLDSLALPHYLDGYSILLYLGFAAGLLLLLRNLLHGLSFAQGFGFIFLVISVFGGVLYHLLFEAKSQYALAYLPMMIPLAAWGLSFPAIRAKHSAKDQATPKPGKQAH